MDYIFRYPLNKAHYYQRQAESKEINRQFSSAKKLRELSLENLNASLSLSSNDVIQGNIRLQIAYEKKQIERLEKLCVGDGVVEPLAKNLSFESTMAQAEGSFKCSPDAFSGSFIDKSPSCFKSLIFDIAKNAEKINLLVREIETKLDGDRVEGSSTSPSPIPCNVNIKTAECLNVDENSIATDILTSIRPMIQQLDEYNSKTLHLSSKLVQEFSVLQLESNKLSKKFDSLKLLSTPNSAEPKQDDEQKRESPISFTLYQPPGNYRSTPLSVEDFAPLDCPPMDFLNAKPRSPKS